MPGIYAIWNSRPAGAEPSTGAAGSAGALGKQDFLNLLAAQLRQQNPLQPLEDSDFMAQTAQFHTLEQLQLMNELLSAALAGNSLAQASSLLGRQVTAVDADGNRIDGLVREVALENGQPVLLVGDTVVDLASVVIIGEAGDA